MAELMKRAPAPAPKPALKPAPEPPPAPKEPPDIYAGAPNGACWKCGQPNGRCRNEHAVIDLDGDHGKGWQGFSLNNVIYDGKNVCVPKEAAQEMLAALNRWRNR
mgnify:FL=1